uniref:Uncharacterized protein n=1 Tax=Trichobilharzia regenti TaxID=157069 RepID=A0AA85IPF5_TRIRE|nr:unnamed protein product [Trichobilharzia regenti]
MSRRYRDGRSEDCSEKSAKSSSHSENSDHHKGMHSTTTAAQNIKRENSVSDNSHSSGHQKIDETNETSDWDAEDEDDDNHEQDGSETPTIESAHKNHCSTPSSSRDHSLDRSATRSENGCSDSEESNEICNKRMLKKSSPPCPRRSRGSEYGRHETVEDDDYADDDSESGNVEAD